MSNEMTVYTGDAYEVLDTLEAESIDMIYTSPNPAFWPLKHGIANPSIVGTEKDTISYMEHLLNILQKVHRVLKPTGSLWLQIADHFHTTTGNVMMIPEQVAFNMVRHGWHLMNIGIWSRSSVREKPPRAFARDWEHLFWFAKTKNYYFDDECGVNYSSVYTLPYTSPKDQDQNESGHPEELIQIAIWSTCPPHGTVLDPFMGTGKTGRVAMVEGRKFIGIEIIPEKAERAREILVLK